MNSILDCGIKTAISNDCLALVVVVYPYCLGQRRSRHTIPACTVPNQRQARKKRLSIFDANC